MNVAFINKCKNCLYKSVEPFAAKKKYMEESCKSYTISSWRTFRYLILVIRREGMNVVHDAIFLHTVAIAEKVHFVHLLMILCFQLLLSMKLAWSSSTSFLNWEFSYSAPLYLASIISHFSFSWCASAWITPFSPLTNFRVLAPPQRPSGRRPNQFLLSLALQTTLRCRLSGGR